MIINSVVIGKRVTIGAAILGAANALAFFYPEKAPAILAIVTPTTLVVQVLVARHLGITHGPKP